MQRLDTLHVFARVLTDTLVHVPSDPAPEGEDVRALVFAAISEHILERLTLPASKEGAPRSCPCCCWMHVKLAMQPVATDIVTL